MNAPVGEQILPEPFAAGRAQKARRYDLIGIDVRVGQHGRARANLSYRFHLRPQPLAISRGSVTRPRTALAAAVSGLAGKVRAPWPWRPSKLRLLVLIEFSPLPTTSPFIPRHIEQPDSRHSAPASMNTRSRPSASAAFLTCCEPGTMSARTPRAILRPRNSCAALRRSDRRPLVQLPMNTTLIG